MKYCETCFDKVNELDKHGECIECSTIPNSFTLVQENRGLKKEEWISVPSPFKAYPPNEGV